MAFIQDLKLLDGSMYGQFQQPNRRPRRQNLRLASFQQILALLRPTYLLHNIFPESASFASIQHTKASMRTAMGPGPPNRFSIGLPTALSGTPTNHIPNTQSHLGGQMLNFVVYNRHTTCMPGVQSVFSKQDSTKKTSWDKNVSNSIVEVLN